MSFLTPKPFREGKMTLDPLGWDQGEMLLIPYSAIPKKGNPIGLLPLTAGDRGLNFARSLTGGIQLGKVPGYWTIPYAGFITAVILNTDQGGFKIRFWKASGHAPTDADVISKDGYTIQPPQTHQEFFDLSDFTTITVNTGDTFAAEIMQIIEPTPLDISGNVVVFQIS
jgi:hypothetical protein